MARLSPTQGELFKLSDAERLAGSVKLCDLIKERHRQAKEKSQVTKEYAENLKALDKEIRVLAGDIDERVDSEKE